MLFQAISLRKQFVALTLVFVINRRHDLNCRDKEMQRIIWAPFLPVWHLHPLEAILQIHAYPIALVRLKLNISQAIVAISISGNADNIYIISSLAMWHSHITKMNSLKYSQTLKSLFSIKHWIRQTTFWNTRYGDPSSRLLYNLALETARLLYSRKYRILMSLPSNPTWLYSGNDQDHCECCVPWLTHCQDTDDTSIFLWYRVLQNGSSCRPVDDRNGPAEDLLPVPQDIVRQPSCTSQQCADQDGPNMSTQTRCIHFSCSSVGAVRFATFQ